MFAKVAFPISNFQTFTYSVPEELNKKIKIGTRVITPFGRNERQGIVVSTDRTASYKGSIKSISRLVDDVQVVTPELWKLIVWISDYYMCPIGQVARAVLPNKLSTNYKPSKKLYVYPISPTDYTILKQIKKRAPIQYKIFNILKSSDSELQISDLKGYASNPIEICKRLEKLDLIKIVEKISLPDATGFVFESIDKKIVFNVEQKVAIEKIKQGLNLKKYAPFLLHGVTSSGKTEIYIEAVRHCLSQNRTAIILLPEIALTPQIAGRFRSVFGDLIALWHSKLSHSQRAWTWKEICKGTFKVVIGARSAIFAPLKKLGLIVIDEEQESSFRQDSPAPRYHARDVAIMRSNQNNCVIILASATPSLESYYNHIKKKLDYIYLSKRYGGAKYPITHLVDMIEEQSESGKYGKIISGLLQQKIEDRLNKKEQIILLQNRRGYSPVIRCEDCGAVLMCPHCKVAISFHIKLNNHLCHFCGHQEIKNNKQCKECNGGNLIYSGTGTQKVEAIIKEIFPKVSIQRLDMDTSLSGNKITSILKSFNSGEIDILLGTQMISKGLDFPNATLVGIINADIGLYLPDFRAGEKIFQLIYQASGRSGRSLRQGEVVIQTYNADNHVIKSASELDMLGFYNTALKDRKELHYPPYSWLAKLEISGSVESHVSALSSDIFKLLKWKYNGLYILGPAPCFLEKLRNQYRFQIIFKSQKTHDPNGKKLHSFVQKNINNIFDTLRFGKNKVVIHFDPLSLI